MNISRVEKHFKIDKYNKLSNLHSLPFIFSVTQARNAIATCSESGCDRVDFLPSNLYDGVVCICGQNHVGNTPVFWLFLSTACTALRLSPFPLCACPASRLGWARSWEGAQWDSSSDPQGFSPSVYFLPIPLERGGSEQLCECLDVNYGQLTALQNSSIILYKYFNCIVCLN